MVLSDSFAFAPRVMTAAGRVNTTGDLPSPRSAFATIRACWSAAISTCNTRKHSTPGAPQRSRSTQKGQHGHDREQRVLPDSTIAILRIVNAAPGFDPAV